MHHAVLPDSLVALLLRQHGIVTRGQIHMLNLSDSALRGWLRRSLLTRIQSGAYADADIWEHADARQRLLLRLLATQLAAPDAIAFGVTAAVVNGLPVRAIPARPQLARACGAPRL
ncbi:MAG: type IV toxin-antitoxin system AbiEi family antitoxin domain-containing protein, partial [Candidatus Nanopelagicales bacterium]